MTFDLKPITEYDKQGNITHYKDSEGYEYRQEYNAKGNLTHYKNSNGKEYWYDNEGNVLKKWTYNDNELEVGK